VKRCGRHSIVRGLALLLLGAAARAADSPAPADRIAHLEKMHATAPDNGAIMYELAVAETGVGRHADAIRWLQKAAAAGYAFDPTNPAFKPLSKFEDFKELERRLSEPPPAHTSALAFRITQPDLIPEGIAWDPVGRSLYVGSLYKKKIVRVGPDGAVRDFVRSGQDGLWTVLGMTVDEKRRTLWVVSAADGREGEAAGSSGLFAFDLETGSLRGKHVLGGPSEKHLFNDLVMTPDGDIYLTDSAAGAIWRLPNQASALEKFLPPGTFDYPNGLAFDRGRLYVADFVKGVSIVDLETRTVRPLRHARDVSLHDIDGLYFYKGSLVAIQNGPGMERVALFRLNPSGEGVEAVRIIESRNPDFRTPTTGAIVGSELFYLANTQLTDLGDDEKLAPGARLRDVLILKAPLD